MREIEPKTLVKIQSSQQAAALQLALNNSPFAARLIQKHPLWLDDLITNIEKTWDKDQLNQLLLQSPIINAEQLKQRLRLIRNQVMLRILVRDVGELANLQEVMSGVSLLADFCIQITLQYVTTWAEPNYGNTATSTDGQSCELAVIAMGKLGGGELNVSSDIDIFFAYPFDGETTGGDQSISHQDYFNRIAKQFIHVLHDITEDGFVFRVDTRLRPFGSSGQLVCSFDMLQHYYQNHGRDWERYALMKARIITGHAQEQLLNMFQPFIFKKYLDFNAIDALRDLKSQILQEVKRRGMQQNIKLGPGGIREIEFIVQAFQLIRGGRQIDLQTSSTLAALTEINRLQLLDQNTCDELRRAYIYLRNIEHRLQYDQDRQTHSLPNDEETKTHLLQLAKFDTWDKFLQELNSHRDVVSAHFEKLLRSDTPTQHSHDSLAVWISEELEPKLMQHLMLLGYQSPNEIHKRLQQIRNGRRYRAISDSNKRKFDQLAQLSIDQAAKTQCPDRALTRSMDLLEIICGRSNYLTLFLEHPKALQQVHNMVENSPFISKMLNQYPLLLDTLLDQRLLFQTIQHSELETELHNRLHNIERYDIELQMDLLREFKQSYIFKVAAQEINNIISLLKISDALSVLAQTILKFILDLAWQQMKLDYQPEFIVAAYGKLGSREMSYGSDLDIIFLFDDTKSGSMQDYIRYSQRINHWLSTYTSFGVLYQTDLRLRPDGSKGLMAIPIDSFESYQQNRAWVWEHQALTKARYVAGSDKLGQRFEKLRQNILIKNRDRKKLKEELLSMRTRIRKSKPSTLGFTNIKNIAGGIIDIEFMVQYLILAYSDRHSELTDNKGNIALLMSAAKLNLIPSELAEQTAQAYQAFRQITHNSLLLDQEISPTDDEELKPLSKPVQALWQILFKD